MENSEKIGAISIRVSTDSQVEYSPDSQIEECLKYAKAHNIYVPPENIYRDDGISGRKAEKRTNFMRMISDAQKQPRPFDVILCYDFSRFARNKEESVTYKALLRNKLGIDVVSITQPLTSGIERVLVESQYEAMDEYFSLKLAMDVRRGKKTKAERGEPMGSAPIGYWYDKNTKTLQVNEAERKVVQFVFEEWIKPESSYNGIASKLNKMRSKTKRGAAWSCTTVKQILNNKVYLGFTRFTIGGMGRNYNNPDTILRKGKHKPIITQELWDAAQAKIAEYDKIWFKWKKPVVRHEYWLRGLLRCSACGKNLVKTVRKTGDRKRPYFQCNGYNKRMCNHSHSIRQHLLEDALLAELKKTFTERWDIKIAKSSTETDSTSILQDSLARQKLRLERIELAYLDGIDSLEEYKAKKTKTLNEIKSIKKELTASSIKKKEAENKEKVYNLCAEAYRILSDPKIELSIKEKIANELFDHIVYNKAENALYITYKEVI